MSRRECPNCGLLLDMWQDLCPNCGSSPAARSATPESTTEIAEGPQSNRLRAINLILALLLIAVVIGVGVEYAKASRARSQQASTVTADAAVEPPTTTVNGISVYAPPGATSKGFWERLRSKLQPRPKPTKRAGSAKSG